MIYKDTKKNHITLRKLYKPFCDSKELKKIFRPGNRTGEHPKAYKKEQIATIKILDIPGSDYHNIEPKHTQDNYYVKIINVQTKKLNELTQKDFQNSGPDKDIKSLITNLSLIYNLNPKEINELTIISFEYLDPNQINS